MSKKNDPDFYSGEKEIVVKGARTHNLKNISLSLPRNKMIVVTGLSGSGKSSLAFDTIFAEGQRRYVESLSSYARQFLNQMQKPDVDEITGLSPAISIDQKSASRNPRSTVATITEIYDYLRILYARIGTPHCLICGTAISRLSIEEIKNLLFKRMKKHHAALSSKAKGVLPHYAEVLAPVVRGRKGEYYQLLYDALNKGYTEAYVDGRRVKLRERIELAKHERHNISLIVDSIALDELQESVADVEERLSEAIERAVEEADGLVTLHLLDPKNQVMAGDVLESETVSSTFSCPNDGYSYPEVEPRLFSFNSPYGACPECKGLGTKYFGGREECPVCNGARLREESLHVLVGGDSTCEDESSRQKSGAKNVVEFTNLTIEDARVFLSELSLTKKENEIAAPVVKEINDRLSFMENVGIEYLTLGRKANTLSGGEAQRIRLASQLGSGLVGALYVLDEPTIGLHPRDNERLVNTLLKLRDLGNTIIVVEHDEDTIHAADYLVEIGPGAGSHGGEVIVADDLAKLLGAKQNTNNSVTLSYLRGETTIPVPEKRRTENKGNLLVKGGHIHNISNLNVKVPLGKFVCVTGVSGSGKSSFVYDILHDNLKARLDRKYRSAKTFNAEAFGGSEYLGRVVLIDQSPIGRTPRSNPATYTGAWTHIRDLFAASTEAKARGWGPGRFSFNVKGGRCEACQGNGFVAVEMHFLPTVYVPCDICNGKRFTKETLDVTYNHKNIHEVLQMTIEEAGVFFKDIPAISDRLHTLSKVGLGYLRLGQSATTLSGGEAQRVKIASELFRRHTEKTIYLLDEPTVGLHYEDVRKLIEILQQLVDVGNTALVIEHNLDLIKSADYIIDIGPEGGSGGGEIVAKGTPESVAKDGKGYTAKFLKKILS